MTDSPPPSEISAGDATAASLSPTADATPPGVLGFAGCLTELDRIVRDLEADHVDVDHLADTVQRAADLVEWCRTKLGDTRLRVDQILPRLEAASGGAPEQLGDGGDE